MGTHAETFPAGRASTRGGIIVGVVVLLLAALGAGVLIGRATEPTTAPKAASVADPYTTAIDALAAAWSGSDPAALANVYAENATLTDANGKVYEGRQSIVDVSGAIGAYRVHRISDVVGSGTFAAAVMQLEGNAVGGTVRTLSLFEFDSNGQIVSHRDFGGY